MRLLLIPDAHMKHRIIVPEHLTYEGLKQEIAQGGKFIVYSYCISLLFAVTLRRISPAYLVPASGPGKQIKKKYNRYNYLFGWWQIPTGLPTTIRNIKINNRGGLDVTEDIMLNITEAAFREKEVALLATNLLFDLPEKPDIKALQKVLHKHINPELQLEELYFGNYINVPEGEDPYFVIGIHSRQAFDTVKEGLDKAIRKEFYKRVYFEYINLDPNAEEAIVDFNDHKALAPFLVQQGVKLI